MNIRHLALSAPFSPARLTRLVVALAGLVLVSPAGASLLYENPFEASQGGGACSPCDPAEAHTVATSFDLFGDLVVTKFAVDLVDISDTPDGFIDEVLIQIYTDDFAIVLLSETLNRTRQTRTEQHAGSPDGRSHPIITFDISDLALSAGHYFVSLYGVNGTAFGWTDSPTPAPGAEWRQDSAFGNIAPGTATINGGMGLQVFGVASVPEPATLGILGLAILGLGMRRRSTFLSGMRAV